MKPPRIHLPQHYRTGSPDRACGQGGGSRAGAARRQHTLDADAAELVSPDGDFKLTVTIDGLRVRCTFDAIMLGFMVGTEQLNRTATLTRLDGRPVGDFKVSTSYGLGGFGGGQDSSRLAWLYEEFAKMLTQELVALRDQKAKP